MIFNFNKGVNKTAAVSTGQRGWFPNADHSGKAVPGALERQNVRAGSGMYGLLVSNSVRHGHWF